MIYIHRFYRNVYLNPNQREQQHVSFYEYATDFSSSSFSLDLEPVTEGMEVSIVSGWETMAAYKTFRGKFGTLRSQSLNWTGLVLISNLLVPPSALEPCDLEAFFFFF